MTSIEPIAGVAPLTGRKIRWINETIETVNLHRLVQLRGSPLNIHSARTFGHNIDQLREDARSIGINLEIFFARKANKCITYLEACLERQAGVDVAGMDELNQTLAAGVKPDKIVCTAAVKNNQLLRACLSQGVTIAVDNAQELLSIKSLIATVDRKPKLALRISGFTFNGEKSLSRFGFDIDELPGILQQYCDPCQASSLSFEGLHFHLAGYSSAQRRVALNQCIDLLKEYDFLMSELKFIDIGGGFPVNYLESFHEWERFWSEMSNAPQHRQLTFRDTQLGWTADDNIERGSSRVYPFAQKAVGLSWLKQIFIKKPGDKHAIRDWLNEKNISVRCEPGRFLLRDCGFTVAMVESVKNYGDDIAVSVAMNQTQCKTGSEDILIDPMLIARDGEERSKEKKQGFLFGSYCTEDDLIIKRKLSFPTSIAPGDLIVLPNTAGYFMHFRESQSHQLPLAKNIFVSLEAQPPEISLDRIDALN